MAKKSKKESYKIQESTSVEAPKMEEAPKIEEAPKTEDKIFIKPACECRTPFGIFKRNEFVGVSKEVVEHLEKYGIKFERAN